MSTIGKFNFLETMSGLSVVAVPGHLSAGCVHSSEVDWAIGALKSDLDNVGMHMKLRLEQRRLEDSSDA